MPRIKDASKDAVIAAADMVDVVSAKTALRRASSARYTGPRMPNPADDAAAPASAEPVEDDADDQPRKPAAATWGTGKATHAAPAPAPQMTSPTALPPKP